MTSYRVQNINGCLFIAVGMGFGAATDFAWWKIGVALLFFGLSFIGAKVTRL